MTVEQLFALDDETEITLLVTRFCRSLGVTATTFNRIDDFKNVREFPAESLILLDLSLGDGNGVDVIRFLAERRCKAAILLMSGADDRLLATVQRLGSSYGLDIQGTLPKPFRMADLKARIEAVGLPRANAARRKASPEEELHRAIITGELVLHYQPKIDLGTGLAIGAEALVRWQHPERGMVPPGQFIPFAEESGLIIPLTRWVLNEAIRETAEWQRRGWELRICVNMPAGMLSEAELPKITEQILAHHGVAGERLVLEVTETGVMSDRLTATDVLTRLRISGISLAIDDFGTGHSSLLKLRQLPFTEVKIDQSFVQDLTTDPDARSLVATMITMAHGLGMLTIAEGVETRETLTLLTQLRCDAAQGYYIARPAPAAEFELWLDENRKHSLVTNKDA